MVYLLVASFHNLLQQGNICMVAEVAQAQKARHGLTAANQHHTNISCPVKHKHLMVTWFFFSPALATIYANFTVTRQKGLKIMYKKIRPREKA